MNSYILLLAVVCTVCCAQKAANETVHFFLLMIPDSKVESLRRRVARQEEGVGGAIGAIGEAVGPAANVGQILQGVLGGDLRPIFAGSTAFIPDGDFRDGVTEILQQTVAPAIQRILTEFNRNVQRHFNNTTPNPQQQQQQQQQQPVNNNNNNNQNANNNQFQQQPPPQQNFNNNFNNPAYQQQQQFQPNYNQFQQQQNPQFAGNFNNGQFNPNYQTNPAYQPAQNYPANQLQQQPGFGNGQLAGGGNQFYPPNNNLNSLPPPNYNQFQQPAVQPPLHSSASNFNNPPAFQPPVQNAQPPFSTNFQSSIPSPVQAAPSHQFQPPAQSFPQPVNSVAGTANFVPRASGKKKSCKNGDC